MDTCADSPVIGLEPESHPKLAMGCAKEQLKCASSTKKSLNNFFRRGSKIHLIKRRSFIHYVVGCCSAYRFLHASGIALGVVNCFFSFLSFVALISK